MSQEVDRDSEILALTEEALILANKAVISDKRGDLYEACCSYDKTVLALDEVIISTPLASDQWKRAAELRDSYNSRLLEIKKNYESSAANGFVGHLFGGIGGPAVSGVSDSEDAMISNGVTSQGHSNSQHELFEPLTPEELRAFDDGFETAPQSMLLVPYWQLRALRSSILHGGYLTRDLLLPRGMWQQHDVKMSGISVKIEAFRAMSALLQAYLSTLKEPCAGVKRVPFLNGQPSPSEGDDEDSRTSSSSSSSSPGSPHEKMAAPTYLFSRDDAKSMSLESVHSFSIALTGIRKEMGEIQNTLSKSFRFIPELEMAELRSVRSSDADVQPVRRDSDLFRDSTSIDTSNSNMNMNDGISVRGTTGTSGNSIADFGSGLFAAAARGMERAGSLVSSGASTLGKNVKKVAEIGISRIGVMQSKVSKLELLRYTSAIVKLAEQCQELHSWYVYYDLTRAALLELDSARSSPSRPVTKGRAAGDCGSGSTAADESAAAAAAAEKERQDQEIMRSHLVSMVEGALTSMLHITRIIKDAICEPLVRDAEVLHTSYLIAMTKSLVAMEWEQ